MNKLKGLYPRFFGQIFDFAKKTALDAFRAGQQKRVNRLTIGDGFESLENRVVLSTTISDNWTGRSFSCTDDEEIIINSNVIINTLDQATGIAGSITLAAPKITINTGVQLLANGATDAQDGAITITADDVHKNIDLNFTVQLEDLGNFKTYASITVGSNTTIDGGNIKITADSGNSFIFSNTTSLFIAPFSKVVTEFFHVPDFGSLPLAIQVWKPTSSITLGGSLSSSGTVSISSTADANASGKAVYMRTFDNQTKVKGYSLPDWFDGGGRYGAAAGYFQTDASATIDMNSGAAIQSTGNVSLGTTVENAIQLEAMANKNNGITVTNPKAIAIAGATGVLNTISTIHVQPGATINTEGSVSIVAEATDENEVEAITNDYRDGTVGLGVAVVDTHAIVQAIVEGTIHTTWVPPSSNPVETLSFNPSLTVDFATSSLVFPSPVTFVTGVPLLFQSVDGATVPGLVPNTTYYAITQTQNPKQLQLATTLENAQNGIPISFGTGFPTLTNSSGLAVPITIVDVGVANAIYFGYSTLADGTTPLFSNGQTVTFAPAIGKFLGYNDANGNLLGPLSGSYRVIILPPTDNSPFPLGIQLVDPQGNIVVLNSNCLLKTNDNTYIPISSFDVSASQLDLNPISLNPATGQAWTIPPNGPPALSNGQELTFIGGLTNPLGNLNNQQIYYAVVNPATPGVIQLALNLAQSESANPAIQNAVPTLLTVANQAFLSGSSTSFPSSHQTLATTLNSNRSYSLWNNANGGTFTLDVTPPQGSGTTPAIAWNASASEVAAAINAISGMVVTVTGSGNENDPWVIAGQYQLPVGTLETGVGLVFDYDPNFADGTGVIFQAVPGKPVYGFTNGEIYYAYNQINANFVPQLPQYVLSLQTTLETNGTPVDFQFGQGFTDKNGQNYTLSGAVASEGQILLDLPQTALVTSTNGAGLGGGAAYSSVVSSGALQFFSFATSGTFTISVEIGTETVTTGPLAYNATASQVEAALNGLAGVSVTVLGLGTGDAPWTMVGLSYGSVTFDCTLLLDGSYQTNILAKELVTNTSQVWTTATSGSFTLTLDGNGQSLTTASIAFNATVTELIEALNALPQVRSSVTGSGTPENPWQITTGFQGIQTGDSLVFHDCWNMPSLGMMDGQTYYAVVSANQFQPQTLLLGMAATLQDAMATPPILIQMQPFIPLTTAMDNTMTGAEVSLAEESSHPDSAIKIKANLVSMDWVTVISSIGLFNMLAYVTHLNGNWDPWGNGKWKPRGHGGHGITEEHHIKHKVPAGADIPNEFELSAAPALVFVTNTVQALVGENAVITSYGDVSVKSILDEILHSESAATICKSRTGESDKAVAIAFNGAFVDNNSSAIIASNAQVSAADISVLSDIFYPFIIKETNLSQMKDDSEPAGAGNVIATIEKFIGNLLFSSNAGISNWLLNHTANTATLGEDDGDALGAGKNLDPLLAWTISASISVIQINNTNLAQIADGAQINQDPEVAEEVEEEQGVTVEAATTVVQTGATGMVYLGLSVTWLLYGIKKDEIGSSLFDTSNSGLTMGGSFNYMSMENNTQALLGGGYAFVSPSGGQGIQSVSPYTGTPFSSTNVHYGNSGLTVEAITYVTSVLLSQAGGKSTGFGFEGSFAVLNMGEQGAVQKKQTTFAQLISDNLPLVIIANPGTNGTLKVEATDESSLWVLSGAMLYGGAKAIGFSGSQVELTRDISATVGNTSATATPTQASTFNTLGTVEIMAQARGLINPGSLVGEYAPNGKSVAHAAAPRGANVGQGGQAQAASDIHGKWGWAVSGDYSAALINDSVNAWINDTGAFTGQLGDQLSIEASNITYAHAISGSAAIVNAHGKTGLTVGLSGSASVVVYESTVLALLANATLHNYQVELIADNAKKVGSFSGGMQVSVVTGSDLNVAGSVAYNQITNNTQATLENVTASDLEEATIEATTADQVWAAAGVLTITVKRRDLEHPENDELPKTVIGVGVSGAMNTLINTTHATISDCEMENLEGALELIAQDFSHSFVFSAGVNVTVPAGMAVILGGMWSTTNIAPDTQAQVTGSNILGVQGSHPATLEVIAAFVPVLISFAGYVALEANKPFSKKVNKIGDGVGAGVVVTNIENNGSNLAQTVASIVDSQINLGEGELTVESYSGRQSDAPTGIVSPLSELPDPDGNSIWSLAIAGSAQGESATEGGAAIGVAVAGALIYTTVDLDTAATIEVDNTLTTIEAEQVTIAATNALLVYSDAGGVTVAGQMSDGPGVGVAIGGAYNSYTSGNSVEATLSDATITTASLAVESLLKPDVTSIAFGVAVDVALAASLGFSLSLSGAFAYLDVTDSAQSSISGGTTTVNGTAEETLTVSALDQSSYQVSSGAGSLAVSVGSAAIALAPSSAIGKITIGNTVEAFIGSTSTNPSSPTTILASVPIVVEATSDQTVNATVVAVAVSVAAGDGAALSGGGASAAITTENTVMAGLLYGTNLTSILTQMGSGNDQGADGITVAALEESTLNASVGAGALSVGEAGGSLGISLAEITTTDTVEALIRGATVSTTGTGVSVEATGNSSLSTMSVPTAVSVSLGVAGAGGNSNITDSSTFLASVDSGSTLQTGNPGVDYGDLTVGSFSQDTLLAQIFGGAGGLGSIGVFMSDTICDGSSTAQIANAGSIAVGDLLLQATGNHTITSDGYSITIGGLAGTGETHQLTYSETIAANIIGTSATPVPLTVDGNATINAQCNTTAMARDSGQDPNSPAQTSYTISGLGVGVYQAQSTFTPTITTTLSHVDFVAEGRLSVSATVSGSNTAQAMAGSGGRISGEASRAETTNSPNASLSIGSSTINAGSITVQAVTTMTYDAYADSVNVNLAGGGGTVVVNSSSPSATVALNSGTTLTSTGPIDIASQNQFQRATLGNDVDGYMVRVGAGGVLTGYGGSITTNFNPVSTVTIADGVSIHSNGIVGGASSGISILATQTAQMQENANLATGGLLVSLDWNNTSQTATVTTSVSIGEDVSIVATAGSIAIGTLVFINASTSASTTTWGLGGNATSSATSNWTVNQSVQSGTNTTIFGLGTVSIVAGENPLNGQTSSVNTLALAYARTRGLIDIPLASTEDCYLGANANLSVGNSSTIQSGGNLYLGANPGNNTGTTYWRTQYDRNFIHSDTFDVLNNSSSATLGGTVEAGVAYQLDILVNDSGDALTINGGPSIPLANHTTFVHQTLSPNQVVPVLPGQVFFPFQAAYNTNYLPNTSSVTDPATAAILSTSVSNTPVAALPLSGLVAQGGNVLVKAGSLEGTATLSAYSPSISITNPSANYLLLDGVSILNGKNAGTVSLMKVGGGNLDQGSLVLPGTHGETTPTIEVNQSYPSAVGTGTTSGPAMLIEGYFNNPAGDVTLTNAMGAIIEIAPIKAVSVTISSPNSAFVLSTPNSYYGVGGNILDAWAATQQPPSGNPPGISATSYNPNYTIPGYAFQPGRTTTGWNANLAATAAYDYLIATHNLSVIGPGARQLDESYTELSQFYPENAEYTYGILFGNAAPYQGNYQDTTATQGQTSYTGSGNILSANGSYVLVGDGNNGQGYLPVFLPDQTIFAQGQDSQVSPYLMGGLTAAQVSITALIIDINAPINVGISTNININLTAGLGTTLTQYQASYQGGTVTSPIYSIPASYLGTGEIDFTAIYNAQTNQITISPIATTSAQVGAILKGKIISTTSWGKINMIGGPGLASINNETGMELVLEGISSGTTEVSGTIEIQDTLKLQNTKYVYQPGQGLATYTSPYIAGSQVQTYPAAPNVTSTSSETTYNPVSGSLISQTASANLWRGLNVGGDVWTTFDNSPNGGFWNFGPQVSNSNFALNYTNQQNLDPKTYTYPTSAQDALTLNEGGFGWKFNNPDPYTEGSNNAGLATTGSAFSPATPLDADNACAFIQNSGYITQSVYLYPGYYSVSFFAAQRSGYENNPITVSIDGTQLGRITPGLTSWTYFITSAPFQVTEAGNYTLQLSGASPYGGDPSTQSNVFVDDVLLHWSPTDGSNLTVFDPYYISNPAQIVLAEGSTNPPGVNIPSSNYTLPSGYQFTEYLVAEQTTNGYFTAYFTPEKHNEYANGMPAEYINYQYPSGYSLNLYSFLKADNPIAIDFGAMQTGNLSVNSNASVILGGGVLFAGNVSINTLGDLSQSSTEGITANEIQLTATQGSLGSEQLPLSVNATSGFSVSAFGEEGVFLSSPGDLAVDDISTTPLAITGFSGGTNDWSLVNGVEAIVGFSGFQTQGAVIGNNSISLQLTDGVNDTATSAWLPTKVSTGSFIAQFTYTPSGARAADGITFSFQNQISTALGNVGGSLGYTGITGQTVAYEMNIYNGHQIGTNYLTNNYTGTYQATGNVNIASGHPIDVTLVYDEISQTLTETLVDSVTSTTYTKVHSNVRLEALLGPTAYLGFTGGDGGATSIQTITNFQFQPNLPQIAGNTLVAIPPGVNNQLSAAWYNTPIRVTNSFEASFVYQALGSNPADGMALVFQNEGLNAIGSYGGSLGYEGIANNQNTAAFEINVYDGHTVGTNFVTNGAWGNYNPTGPINMASGHQILVNLNYDQSSGTLFEALTDLDTGATYSTQYSINLAAVLNAETSFIGFTASDGGAFASQTISDFRFGYLTPALAEVVITANGNITAANGSSGIQGSNISLNSTTGSIGTASQAITLELNPQTLANGSITGGIFNATAAVNIYASQSHGNLRVGSVSAAGTVSLSALQGSIVDGLLPDGSGLNTVELTTASRSKIMDFLSEDISDSTTRTVTTYEGMIDRNYLQYWNLVPNGTVQNGVFVVNADDISVLEPQVAAAYGIPTATNDQVQTWANDTWQQCVTSFANTLAFGPTWQTLPQFGTYDSTYVFIAPASTVDQLTAGSTSAFGLIAGISLVALEKQDGLGNTPTSKVNIQAGNLALFASESVGNSKSPVVIPLADIENQTLTPVQKELLTMASLAGEVMMVGTNIFGESQLYYYDNPPYEIVPTGVQVIITRPLFVDVAVGGTITAQSGDAVLLTETAGDMNIDSIQGPGTVRLTAEGSILSSSGSGPTTITSNNLFLIANGPLGSGPLDPLSIEAVGRVDAYSKSNVSLNQVTGNLNLGQINSGGAISLTAEQSILDNPSSDRQSIEGFNEDGTGWTASSVNGQVSITNNDLTFTNQVASNPDNVDWPSVNGLVLSQTVGLNADFTVSFLYQSTGLGGGLAFTLMNPFKTTVPTNPMGLSQQGTMSFVLDLGNGSANSASAGFDFYSPTGPAYIPQSAGSVVFNSGDPIMVNLAYSIWEESWTCVLTDTVTGETATLVQTGLNLLQLLGTDKVLIGFSAFGSGTSALTQNISEFNLVDGAANLQGASLTATAGGSFGTESDPITMLILNEVQITAPDGIYAEQLLGNMNIGPMTSNGVVSLSADQGSVVAYVPPATKAVGPSSTRSGTPIKRSGPALPLVKGSEVRIEGLLGIGTTASPIQTVTGHISGRSRLGDISLQNRGELTIGAKDGLPGKGLFAGGDIHLSNEGTLHVPSAITASAGVSLNALSGSHGPAKILVENGSRIVAHGGIVSLFGNEGLETAPTSSLESLGQNGNASHVSLATGVSAHGFNGQITTNLLGTIHSGTLAIQGGSTDQVLSMALTSLKGIHDTPLAAQVGGYQSVHADDTLFADGRSFVLDQQTLSTSTLGMEFSTPTTLLLNLGTGNDSVSVGKNSGLNGLRIEGNEGLDSFFISLGDQLLGNLSIEGGEGIDQLVTNTLGENGWAAPGILQTWNNQLHHSNMEQIKVNGCAVLNGLPNPVQSVDSTLFADQGASRQFVQTVFAQVLGRQPNPAYLDQSSRRLDNHSLSRTAMATEIGTSSEAYSLMVGGWYKNYLGRTGQPFEIAPWVKLLQSNHSETEVLSHILSSPECAARMATLQKGTKAAERYITGVYRLVIDPSGAPSPAVLTNLLKVEKAQGKIAVARAILGSAHYLAHQAESLNIQINQQPSNGQVVSERLELASSTQMRSWLLGRTLNETPLLTATPFQHLLFTEGHAPVALGGNVRLTDLDAPRNFNLGMLRVNGEVNATAEDRLTIKNQGSKSGQIGVQGNQVTYSGKLMGTFSGGKDNLPLVVNLHSHSTPEATQALIRNIQFSVAGDNPSTKPRAISFVLNDGTGRENAQSQALTIVVQVQAINNAPTIRFSQSSVHYRQGGGRVFLDREITLSDVDNIRFSGGELSVAIANGTPSDYLGLNSKGSDLVTLTGNRVMLSGNQIASYKGGVGTKSLVISFTENATVEAVQELARNLTFGNFSTTPSTFPRKINFVLKDGMGGVEKGQQTILFGPK